jgi:hypothetical protein
VIEEKLAAILVLSNYKAFSKLLLQRSLKAPPIVFRLESSSHSDNQVWAWWAAFVDWHMTSESKLSVQLYYHALLLVGVV